MPHSFDPSRRQFQRYVLAALAATALPVRAAGESWLPINPPQPGDSPGKIEVLEFFSWGCSHCRNFNPLVSRWSEKLPADVVFKKVPITFGRAAWVNLARMYYALEAMGELKRLDEKIFATIHDQHADLYTDDQAVDWVKKNGVDGNKFRDAMRSFSTETRMVRAEQLSKSYKVDSVPMLTVAGRYRVVNPPSHDQTPVLRTADQLIERARKEMPKGGKR